MPTISDNTTGSPVGDFTGTSDTQIREGSPTTNYETGTTVEVTKYGAGDYTHLLLSFPGLSNITGPVTVTSVTLGLYQTDATGTYAIRLYRLLRNWVEAQATWNIYSTGNSWSTAGAQGSGTDRESSLSGTTSSIGTTAGYATETWTSGSILADVEGWINGSVSNYGWVLERDDAGEDATYKVFSSSEGTNGQRPYLTVVYTAGGGGGGAPGSGVEGELAALGWSLPLGKNFRG